MSDAHNHHESAIRTPKQLVAAVAGFFLVTVIGIILLVSFVTTTKLTGAGTESQSAESVIARVHPVADEGFTLKDAKAPKVLQAGESVFATICSACHTTGAAGAPKIGDAPAWAPRIAQGYDTLLKHAIEGIRAMPAKGGNPDLDDVEVARAVVYMTNKAGAKFKESEASATPAAALAGPPAQVAATTSVQSTVAPVVTTALAVDTGKNLYTATCAACHGVGIAGAPKFGDKAAWAPRLAQGTSILYGHAIRGFQGKAGMMPPKGGSSAPDEDVKAAVDYMAAAAK